MVYTFEKDSNNQYIIYMYAHSDNLRTKAEFVRVKLKMNHTKIKICSKITAQREERESVGIVSAAQEMLHIIHGYD